MGERINLNTAGTHCIGAYLAKPAGAPKGGIVVVQEIFGVTPHIRDVADRSPSPARRSRRRPSP